MLNYKIISEAYSLAEKTGFKAPNVKRDDSEGVLNKFLKNIGKAKKNLSKNLEKSKENLSKNVEKSKENLEKHLEASKQNLKKNLGLNKPETKPDQDDAKSHLQKLLSGAKKAAEEHPAAAGALGALAAGAGALGVKKLLSRKKKTA